MRPSYYFAFLSREAKNDKYDEKSKCGEVCTKTHSLLMIILALYWRNLHTFLIYLSDKQTFLEHF